MSGTASRSDVIIIGGGQAGVSLAYYLRQRNLSHIVLERDRPFASWRGRWDGFRANTPNWMNTLPMLGQRRMPRAEADEFASRDELVRYLDECLRVVDPPLVLGADVTSVREVEGGWEVQAGDCSYRVDNVAVCTGAMNTPRVPAAARQLPTHIRTLHSSEYVSPEQITTANVLVVGSASSGMQILRLLAETGRFGGGLHLATSRVLVLPKHVAGVPIHRVVNAFGLFDVRTRSPLGKVMYSGLETRGDPIMPPTPKQLARQYGVQLYGKLTGFDASGLRFADGQTLAPDDLTVIWCTGFRSDYAYIEPLDRSAAFDTGGFPLHVRGVVEGAPGLYFVGLRYQHTSASHDIYGVGQDARYVAEHIQRRARRTEPLAMVPVETCCVCDTADADVIARGYDFEYATSPDEFSAWRCRACRELSSAPNTWPGSRDTSPTSRPTSWTAIAWWPPTTTSTWSNARFGRPRPTSPPECSTGCAIASRPTSPSCSPRRRPARHRRTGQSINKIVKTYGRCGPPRSPSAASRSPPRPNKSWTTSPAVVTKPMRLRQISRSDDSPEPGPVTVLGVDETWLAARTARPAESIPRRATALSAGRPPQGLAALT